MRASEIFAQLGVGQRRSAPMTHFHDLMRPFLTGSALLFSSGLALGQTVPASVASSPVAVEAPQAHVSFESSPEHLAIYRSSFRRTSWVTVGTVYGSGTERDHQRLCVAPCEVLLPAGTDTYSVARVAEGEEWPRAVGAITIPAGSSSVAFDYHDRSTVRRVGSAFWISGFGGLVYGFVRAGLYAKCEDRACKGTQLRGVAWGGGLMVGAWVVGGILVGVDDVVDVKVTRRAQAFEPSLPRARQLTLRGRL